MTSGAPWSVKGIDPKAREIAKDLARRSGMTLGEWLNQVIYEDNAQTEPGAPSLRAGAAGERPSSENRPPRRSGDDLDRVLAALQELSERFDASIDQQAETSARFERAIADLKADQDKVAARLNAVEREGASGAGDKVQTLRALEGALNKVAGHMASGESRHREAMAGMRRELGEEMARVADQVSRQVIEVENRGADAIAQVAAEMTRVASAVEQRLRRADDSQAVALERLGGEIARITERLSDRIAAAERRTTTAAEDVGAQLTRVAERIHARQERNESELVERMRQSEERTARLLEEARQTIDRRLLRVGVGAAEDTPVSSAFADRWTPVDVEAESGPVAAERIEEDGLDAESILEASAYHGLIAGAAAQADYHDHDDEDDERSAERTASAAHDDDSADDAAPTDTEALEAVARALEADGPLTAREPWRPAADPDALRPTTRELVAEARAAAFADRGAPRGMADIDEAEDDEADTPFVSLSPRRSKPSHSMRGVLLAGGAAASISLAAAGYVALHPDMISGVSAPAAKPIPVGPPSSPAAPAPQVAVALATTPASKTDGVDTESLYRDAAAKVEAGDPTGLTALRTAANLSYAPAQRLLGELYEDGRAGLEKDPVEGRRWNQRAAANGDARGMHNLALDYYQGTGGAKSASVAATYFGRAAQLGLRDSQFNLARFYEQGVGVQRDPAAAYRWYLIAARAGDTQAASLAAALKSKLTAEDSARAEAQANAFRPDPAAPPQSLTSGLQSANPKSLALAARALASLGYYKGVDDGAPSQALGQAIQAYQRDRGLAQNGQLSPELVQTFAHISQ